MLANVSLLELPPLSLYIHIPWCVQKCPYCDFNSHQATQTKNAFNELAYIETLKNDLIIESQFTYGRKLRSIFFGGGTPSLFSAKSIETILQHAEHIIGFEQGIEITLEANPGTFEQEKFSGFYQAGVNRLSIGIQSFNEKQLNILGRIHNSDEAKRAVDIAKQAGFSNINIDIMHGLPEQSIDDALSDLQQAIDCSPQHLSWYQLTIEPNTAFYRQPPALPHDDILADIQQHGFALLNQHGFSQYEVSAFSQVNKPSLHNINYWQFGDYLGIGAGAHGKITNSINRQIIRRQKTRSPDHYLQHPEAPTAKELKISADELPLEFMMNALRLIDGVPTHFFEQRTGVALQTIQARLTKLRQQQLLTNDPSRIQTTPLGQQFLNVVLEKFDEDESAISTLTLDA